MLRWIRDTIQLEQKDYLNNQVGQMESIVREIYAAGAEAACKDPAGTMSQLGKDLPEGTVTGGAVPNTTGSPTTPRTAARGPSPKRRERIEKERALMQELRTDES